MTFPVVLKTKGRFICTQLTERMGVTLLCPVCDNAHFCNVSLYVCAYAQVSDNIIFFPMLLVLKLTTF